MTSSKRKANVVKTSVSQNQCCDNTLINKQNVYIKLHKNKSTCTGKENTKTIQMRNIKDGGHCMAIVTSKREKSIPCYRLRTIVLLIHTPSKTLSLAIRSYTCQAFQ